MQLHERTMLVQKAECDCREALCKVLEKHDVTYIELLGILNSLAASWLKYALRAERHPDDDEKRADEA